MQGDLEESRTAEPPPEGLPGLSADGPPSAEPVTGGDEPVGGSVVEAPAQPVGDVHAAPGLPVPGPPDGEADESDALDPDELAALIVDEPAAGPRIRKGSRCKGIIVQVRKSDVVIDFGEKVEGVTPLEEFRKPNGELVVEVGQEVGVIVDRMGGRGAPAVLSHRRVREAQAWRNLEEAFRSQTSVKAHVVGRVKGGLRVDVGVAGFLPHSQIDERPVRDLDVWIGRTLDVAVISCERRRSNTVVSRRTLLEAERKGRQEEVFSKLVEGEPATGTVTGVVDHSVFVDLGGVDGRIRRGDLSHGRVGDPRAIVKVGQEVTARVLRIDREAGRVSLSLRAMAPDPWATVSERYAEGDRVRGRVTSVQEYGAFVELEPGIEGLIRSVEIDWSRNAKSPAKTFTAGAETEAVILSVDARQRQVGLSFKRLTPDPWEQYGEELQVGKVVSGVVRRAVDYGIFVEIVPGIEGLVHVSDIAWSRRDQSPRTVGRRNREINTVILQVDLENRRLSLGIKQLEPDAWDTFLGQVSVGDTIPGLVLRTVNFGAFVELAPGVEGLCHSSQAPAGSLHRGQRYPFAILEINEGARRIRLRCDEPIPLDEAAAAADRGTPTP